jgi:hypothetical protein
MNKIIKNSKDLRCEILSFKSEKLEVDYLTLNISIEGHVDPKRIGEFLLGYGFNSKVLEHENAEGEKLFFNNKNKYEVILVKSNWNPQENRFWNGIAVRFAGCNGKFFYHLFKQNRIRFGLFPVAERDIRLGRLDLCYCFDFSLPELGKRSDIKNFLASCKKKFLSKYPSQKVSIARKYLKLTAPVRKKAKRYYRIYEKANHLRFELEMRQECLKYCLNSFFSYSFEEFEDELVGIFLAEFQDLCPEDSEYSFWLLDRLRRKSSLSKLKNLSLGISKAIVSPYNLNFCKDLESSFKCLQLVSFLQRGDVRKDLSFANSINIAIVEFTITDFLRFLGKNPGNTHHREKYMSFFLNLLELEPLKIKINDNKFVAFNFCHWVGLEKRKNTWFVELRVAANILSSIYPYTLSDTLLIYKKKSELELNSQFIESFNTKNSWKEFEIDKTYKDISLSNLAIEKRQSTIINKLNELKNVNQIESKIRISSRGKDNDLTETVEIKNLTPKRLKNASKIFFKESCNSLE